jgi:hypothetical protein
MSFQSVILPVLTGGGSATVITTGAGALVVRTLKRIAKEVVSDALAGVAKEDDVKAIATDVNTMKLKLAAETGGNSNGLRQAVDSLAREVNDVKLDVAHVKGYMEAKQTP